MAPIRPWPQQLADELPFIEVGRLREIQGENIKSSVLVLN